MSGRRAQTIKRLREKKKRGAAPTFDHVPLDWFMPGEEQVVMVQTSGRPATERERSDYELAVLREYAATVKARREREQQQQQSHTPTPPTSGTKESTDE